MNNSKGMAEAVVVHNFIFILAGLAVGLGVDKIHLKCSEICSVILWVELLTSVLVVQAVDINSFFTRPLAVVVGSQAVAEDTEVLEEEVVKHSNSRGSSRRHLAYMMEHRAMSRL